MEIMNKEIMELNISEESKILILKLEKKISSLSIKAQEHFDSAVSLSADSIKDAYSNNENLISILEKNDEIAIAIREEASDIRSNHQTNFTREQKLEVLEEIDQLSIINNTVNYKDNLVGAEEKMRLLHKKKRYLENRNSKRKEEYDREKDKLDIKLNQEKVLDITPMYEDIRLIDKYLDEKRITKGRLWYIINIMLFIFVVVIIGVVVWINIG